MSTIDIKPTASLIVDQITDSGGNVPNFLDGFTVGGRYLNDSANDSGSTRYLRVVDSSGPPTDSALYPGLMWYWDSNEYLSIYVSENAGWRTLKGTTIYALGNHYLDWGGDRSVRGGGWNSSTYNTNGMDYWSIQTNNNAQDFGDLTGLKRDLAGTGSNTRGLFLGGGVSSASYYYANEIDYITISTPGNSTDFGNLTSSSHENSAAGNGTTALHNIGYSNYPTVSNTVDRITIATTGNSSDHGDLIYTKINGGANADSTRALFAGGQSQLNGGTYAQIDYLTIASTGNSADFGDLTQSRQKLAGISDTTRGIFAGGVNSASTKYDIMDYVTIQSLGNATDFGDLISARQLYAGTSNGTHGNFFGGNGPSLNNEIQYMVIQTAGNAVEYGDLTETVQQLAGVSGDPS
jgi:hypothetical protein